jgi:uncharacterized surface protein with fasciclin (FAS1) repeats
MKATILSTCAMAAIALLTFAYPAAASPLSFTVNLDSGTDLPISEPVQRKEGTIMDVLRQDNRFRRVVRALEENSGLRDDLDQRKMKLTFFAPTDEAFEHIKDVLDSIRENRRRRRGLNENDRRDRDSGDEDRRDMENVLQYHILKDETSVKDLFNGQLLQTELHERNLEDKRQRIRVFEFFGQYYLNMYARVHREQIQAENGHILIIDHVLCPPLDANNIMSKAPFAFSTMLVAAEKTNMLKTIEDVKGLTIFAPNNNAWMSLGMQNLIYLFSPRGCNDLKRIVQYHIGKNLLYSTDMMKEKKMQVQTLLQNQQLEINACERKSGRGGHYKAENRREEEPSNWIFTINNGEARVEEHFSDFLAENGVIQSINSVLIPSDVELPYLVGM